MKKLLILLLFPLLGFSQVIGGVDFDVKYFSFLPDSVKTTMRTQLIATMNGALTAGSSLALTPASPLRTRYVTASAAGGNNGTTEGLAWTLAEGLANETAGDLIWIKAGDYGDQNITFSTNGTAANPIYWIGYLTTTGDISATTAPTLTKDEFVTDGYDFIATDYPTFTGAAQTDDQFTLNGDNITVTGDYRVFRNIQSRRYLWSWLVQGAQNVLLENCFVANNRWDGHNSYGGTQAEIGGTGFEFRNTQNSEMMNCLAIDNGFRNFMITDGGDYNRIAQSYSWSTTLSELTVFNAVDYYFVIIEGEDPNDYAEYNMIEDSYAGRTWGNALGWGHGLDFNTNARHNVARNNTIYNLVPHNHGRLNSYNIKANNYYEGGHSEYPSATFGYATGGTSYIDGAIYNYSYGNTIDDSYVGISFADQGKEKIGTGQYEEDNAGWYNLFVKDTITLTTGSYESMHVQIFWESTSEDETSHGNQFHEMDFNAADNMFEPYKEHNDFLFIESTINDVPDFLRAERTGRGGYKYPDGMNYNTEFNNVTLTNSFSIPVGFSITSDGYGGGSPPADPITGNRRIFDNLFYEH